MHNRESLHKRNELFAPDTSYLRKWTPFSHKNTPSTLVGTLNMLFFYLLKWTPLLYTHVGIICTLFAQVAVLSTQASNLSARAKVPSTQVGVANARV